MRTTFTEAHRRSLGAAQTRRWARERIERGGPVWAQRQRGPVGEALARNGSRKCVVKGCRDQRYGLGRHCAAHASNLRQTGHPVARNLRRADWQPLVLQAHAFVCEQVRAGHPAIMTALGWLHEELRRAERPTTHDTTHLRYAEALVRAHRRGVNAADFLARWVAGELADNRCTGEPGPRFATDVHASHQRARLFLYSKPFGDQRRTWARRKRSAEPTSRASRIPWSVRKYAFERLNSVLGVLALRAAAEIRQRQETRDEQHEREHP
jgi:hypothetical protein